MNDPNAIALTVYTDGRDDLLKETLRSRRRDVHGLFTTKVVHDDTGDPDHAQYLRDWLGNDWVVIGGPKVGFGGAIRRMWDHLRQHTTEPYIFHLEDDFTFNAPVYLDAMIQILEANPQLAQLALRRQPWNDAERAAGGIIEQDPTSYTERVNGTGNWVWLEHTKFFTTNPSLYRRELLGIGWPEGPHSEGHFTQRCLGSGRTFGYWGTRTSKPWVNHIGIKRVGTGYR